MQSLRRYLRWLCENCGRLDGMEEFGRACRECAENCPKMASYR